MKENFENQDVLIDSLHRGDRSAYRFLYDRYYSELCVYAANLLKGSTGAEDLVQAVMVKLWHNRKKLRINTSVRSYLYRSVYHNFIDQYRKKQKEQDFLERVRLNTLSHLADEDEETLKRKKEIIRNEIEKLPPKCREAFLLNKVNGLRYKEVSEEMGISIKTVEAHIHKALVQLKKSLEDKKHLFYLLLFGRL